MNFQLLLAEPLAFIFAGFGIISLLVSLLLSVFWIWMIIDCLTNGRLQGTEKLIWVLVVIFLHFLGALLYYFLVRGGRTRF